MAAQWVWNLIPAYRLTEKILNNNFVNDLKFGNYGFSIEVRLKKWCFFERDDVCADLLGELVNDHFRFWIPRNLFNERL